MFASGLRMSYLCPVDNTGTFGGMQIRRPEMTSQSPAFVLTVRSQMADYRERVAERIIQTREQGGFSREELALRAGVSVKQLKRIEASRSEPRLSTVRKLAAAMDVDVTDLRPDLEAEDQAIREWMERIERKLDLVSEIRENQLAIADQVAAILTLTQAIQAVAETRIAPSEEKPPARNRSRRAG